MSMDNKTGLRSGFAAMIGRPNVGKSTIMNRLIGQKISITSDKPQTTRNKIQTVYTDERGQIIFLDTPGMNRAKNKLGDYMLKAASSSIGDADIILWVAEPCSYIGSNEKMISEELKKIKTPVILVLNKTDTVRTENIFESIDVYRKEFDFREIVPVSAKTGDNFDELIKVMFQYLPEGPMYYDEDTLTDQPVKNIAAEIIREKALYCLENEVPLGIAVTVDRFKERYRNASEEIIDIDATIICEKESHKGIIIGKGGSMLKRIGSLARRDIEKLTDTKVNLKLWVRVKKDWRDSDTQLKNFGYE